MKYILKKHHHNIPDEVLLKDIRKIARKHGKRTLSRAQYVYEGTFGKSTIVYRFGCWNRALELAGLEIGKLAFITTEQLMQNMKQVWETLGRQPHIKEMKPAISAFSGDVYVRRYGRWRKALESFVRYQLRHGKNKRVYKTVIPILSRKPKRRLKLHITKSMRFDIMKRDNFKCRLCGASPAINPGVTLHIDHIIPRSKKGETIPANLQTLCSDCNYGKGTKT